MYNSYEEYMQNVLGMNVQNTYMQNGASNYYVEPRVQEVNLPEVNKLYPEIYNIIYPMVQKSCSIRSTNSINETQINAIVEEIYNAIEPGDDIVQGKETGNSLKNGDVKNPRAKETRRPNNNYLLRDLIRILVIRELFQGGRPGVPQRPPMRRRHARSWRKTTCYETWFYGNVLDKNGIEKKTLFHFLIPIQKRHLQKVGRRRKFLR